MIEIDAHRGHPGTLMSEPHAVFVPVSPGYPRPAHLGVAENAWKRHEIDVGRREDRLCPQRCFHTLDIPFINAALFCRRIPIVRFVDFDVSCPCEAERRRRIILLIEVGLVCG